MTHYSEHHSYDLDSYVPRPSAAQRLAALRSAIASGVYAPDQSADIAEAIERLSAR